MPAKTVIFDQRVKIIADLGLNPRNFLSYNPQGRLLCVAGFGNLAGQIDIYDRQTLKKVVTFEAPNTVHCEWSPDGRFLMCATLSPRLRVDNGIKVYHFTGSLMHVQEILELYQVRPRSHRRRPLEPLFRARRADPRAHALLARRPRGARPTRRGTR